MWDPKSEVRDHVSKVWESACGVWELKGEAWDLSSHQLPLNLTPASLEMLLSRSLINIRKSIGPNIDPCGTPLHTRLQLEYAPSTLG